MSNNKKFDDVLDNCLERLLVKSETIEQCLQSYPKHSDELKPLLEMVIATRQVTAIQPRPEFREQARYRFQAALRETGEQKKRPLFNRGWQPRWAVTAATALVVLITAGGTVAAASGSMPDNPLYPVKLATEQAQVTLTFSKLGKAELHARIADNRVTEIIYLTEKGKPGKITKTTDSLNTHLAELSVLVSAPMTMRDTAPVPAPMLQEATVKQAAPSDEEAEAEAFTVTEEAPKARSIPALEETVEIPVPPPEVIEIAEEPVGGGGEASLETNPRAEFAIKIASRSSENIARLRDLLEKAPESARPALLRAISVLENGYRKAIESLNQP